MLKAVSVHIARFAPGQLRRILKIEGESFPADEWPPSLFLEYAADCPLFLVAKVGRIIAGYAVTSVRGERAELLSIAVAERFRGKGVAARLLTYTLRRLDRAEIGVMVLMVRRSNEGAIRLYRRFGFVRTHTVPGYYEDGESAWRMKKVLSDTLSE
jgi:ribosomal-protein-alanine N-acetyltransferase